MRTKNNGGLSSRSLYNSGNRKPIEEAGMSERVGNPICGCISPGSIDFHQDDKKTLVLVGGKLYELLPISTTFEELLEMPADDVPHVRHLNPIRLRSKEEQKQANNNSAGKILERAAIATAEKWKALSKNRVIKKRVLGKTKHKQEERQWQKMVKLNR